MVLGLDVFREHFAPYSGQYALIGGTAASVTMESVGLEFRQTKDFDIVLFVESLTPEFAETFWRFIKAGGYTIGQKSSGKPTFYRFLKPSEENFPYMLELFSRMPDGLEIAATSELTPIPFEEELSSLSAILMDEDYYRMVIAQRKEADGLSWIGHECLIPLKAHAWLDLRTKKEQGGSVDSRDVKKHRNDVLRLSQLLTEDPLPLVPPIHARLMSAMDILETEDFDPRSIDLKIPLAEMVQRIRNAYRSAE